MDVGAAAVASSGADGVGLRHEHGGCEGGAGSSRQGRRLPRCAGAAGVSIFDLCSGHGGCKGEAGMDAGEVCMGRERLGVAASGERGNGRWRRTHGQPGRRSVAGGDRKWRLGRMGSINRIGDGRMVRVSSVVGCWAVRA